MNAQDKRLDHIPSGPDASDGWGTYYTYRKTLGRQAQDTLLNYKTKHPPGARKNYLESCFNIDQSINSGVV